MNKLNFLYRLPCGSRVVVTMFHYGYDIDSWCIESSLDLPLNDAYSKLTTEVEIDIFNKCKERIEL